MHGRDWKDSKWSWLEEKEDGKWYNSNVIYNIFQQKEEKEEKEEGEFIS